MNNMHKTLTITFLAVSIFISGLSVDFVGAQNAAVGPAALRRPEDLLQSRYLGINTFNQFKLKTCQIA